MSAPVRSVKTGIFHAEGGIKVQGIGEFRPPRKGEYFLSGARVCGYRAPNDLSTSYWIARPIPNR